MQSRHRDRDFALRRALLAADVTGLFIALAVAFLVGGVRGAPLEDLLWLLPTLPLWAVLFWAYRLYGRSIRRFQPTHLDDAPSLFHALVLGTLGLWLYYKLVAPVPRMNLVEVLTFAALALPLIAGLRTVMRAINLRIQGPERVFAIAPAEDVARLQRKLSHHPEYEMALAGTVDDDGGEELGLELNAAPGQVESLVASGEIDHLMVLLDASYLPQSRVQELMHACHREGVRFSCFPAARGLLFPGIEVNHLEGIGLLTSNPPVLSRTARAMKRVLDVTGSAALLTLLAPLMAIVAALIKLTSEGPALYRQVRVGRDGERFEVFKFRTMVAGADRMDGDLMESSVDPDWLVMDRDPRVTRLGRFLRHSSIDELPQLWNVLRGEMSLVGPRPLSERDDAKVYGWQRNRLDLTPGMTGYWQVLGRNGIPFQEMLEVDYAYVASWSLWYDLKLLAQTFPAVIRRRGAN